MTDKQLAAGCKKGNELIQRQLYNRYHPKMLGVCIRYAQNRQEAQDILQDGFIKVYMNITSFKGTGSLSISLMEKSAIKYPIFTGISSCCTGTLQEVAV